MEYGLIGHRLGHSYSPQIHRQLGGYDYQLMPLEPEELETFIRGRHYRGLNVTVPYKRAVMAYLDEIDPLAEEAGAVNTIVNDYGRLKGYNTDIAGLEDLVRRADLDLKDKKVMILGSGGTSHTAKALCHKLQAREVLTVSRTPEHDQISYQESLAETDTQIIINTTPCGMYPDIYARPLDISGLDKLEGIIDVIYNPLNTRLVLDGRERGIKAENGLYMLVSQAARSVSLFTGKAVSDQQVEKLTRKLRSEKRNIVLIGMPGSGKSSIGRQLAAEYGRQFIDTDQLIEENTGESIPQIFADRGETAFRKLETEAVRQAGRASRSIISTGGGVILNNENMLALKSTGLLFWIRRQVDDLEINSGRPLSRSVRDNRDLYEKREPLYRHWADHIIDNDGSLAEAVGRIKEVMDEDTDH